MKNNVLNTLLIAFFLIGGWTLFTIWQDLRNADGWINSETIFSKGKNYLPILPRSGSANNNLPVYKESSAAFSNGMIKQGNRPYNSGGQIFSSSAFDISQPTATVNIGAFPESGGSMGTSGRRTGHLNTQNSVAPFSFIAPKGLFQGRSNRLIAKEGTGNNNQSQGSISGSSLASDGPMKVFGEGEGDPLEGGGGNENLNEYNDNSEVPVGGGLVVLMVLAGIYTLVRNKKIV